MLTSFLKTILIVTLPLSLFAQKPSFGVDIVGHGRPMILIPGMKGSGPETFATTIAHFKDHYTCYVITLAGFAGQPPTTRTTDLLKGQRDDLIQYISNQHLEKPILVGFSFGGSLALWMACTAPDLFGPIIDLDGAPFDAGFEDPTINVDSLKKATDAMLQRIKQAPPSLIAKRDSLWKSPPSMKKGFEDLKKLVSDTTRIPMILKWDTASDMRSSNYMIFEMDKVDLRDSIVRISSPILALCSWKGYETLTTRPAVEAAMKNQFAKAKHVRMEFSDEGRHFLMWDDYDWMVKQIDKFLAQDP